MAATPTLWTRLSQLVVVMVVIAAFVVVGLWYLPLIRENQSLRKQDLKTVEEIQKEQEKARQKKAAIDALRNDPRTVERLARERLGLARTNETVVHFEPVAASTTSSPPAPQR